MLKKPDLDKNRFVRFITMTTPNLQQFNCDQQGQKSWLDRALICADLVKSIAHPDRPIDVIDIGCGDMKLSSCLKQLGLDFRYFGYDLIPQNNTVRKINVEEQSPDQKSDVVVMLGVTEYLHNLQQVLARLTNSAHYLIISHVISDHSNYSEKQLLTLNWKNHLSKAGFEFELQSAGYRIVSSTPTTNNKTTIWLCESLSVVA